MKVRAFHRRWRAGEGLAARLSDAGLLPGCGPLVASEDRVELARALGPALAAGAPAEAAFLQWLAGRVDLLPPAACRILHDPSPDVPESRHHGRDRGSRRRVAAAARRARTWSPRSAEPVAQTAFRTTWRGRLADGRPVVVVLARADAEADLAAERRLPLAAALDRAALPGAELVADFLRAARHEARPRAGGGGAGGPRRRRSQTSATWWCRASPSARGGGWRRRVAWSASSSCCPTPPSPTQGRCSAPPWCGCASSLSAAPLPCARRAAPWVLADGRVAWLEGPFAALPAASQIQLWSYLVAAVDTDPTSACGRLLPGARRPARIAARGRVPDAPAPGGADARRHPGRRRRSAGRRGPFSNTLRIARECGFVPRRPLAQLAASLSDLACAAVDLAPDGGTGAPGGRGATPRTQRRRVAPGVLTRRAGGAAGGLRGVPDRPAAQAGRGARPVGARRSAGAPWRWRRARGSAVGAVWPWRAAAAAVVLAAPRLVELMAAGPGLGQLGGLAVALLAAVLVGNRLGAR